jgi:hypothetical protein
MVVVQGASSLAVVGDSGCVAAFTGLIVSWENGWEGIAPLPLRLRLELLDCEKERFWASNG